MDVGQRLSSGTGDASVEPLGSLDISVSLLDGAPRWLPSSGCHPSCTELEQRKQRKEHRYRYIRCGTCADHGVDDSRSWCGSMFNPSARPARTSLAPGAGVAASWASAACLPSARSRPSRFGRPVFSACLGPAVVADERDSMGRGVDGTNPRVDEVL
jgi:hypothetical protein